MGQDGGPDGSTAGDRRAHLLALVKKTVKQLMEESVTRKFVHEDSPSITALCTAVDGCLSHGLRRRALGLFKTSSTTALLYKICKQCEPAAITAQRVHELESGSIGVHRLSSSGDSILRSPIQRRSGGTAANSSATAAAHTVKHMWLRQALFTRQLATIVTWLVQHSDQFYERSALLADAESGTLLGALLVGPCALEYTRLKTCDHYWSDPPADELVQRARISAVPYSSPSTPSASSRRPGLHHSTSRRPLSIDNINSSIMTSIGSQSTTSCISTMGNSTGNLTVVGGVSTGAFARDYVESLHQNSRTTLLYGKNNVLVQSGGVSGSGGAGSGGSGRQLRPAQPGYLSLHQLPDRLVLKWTPNLLMNGCRRSESADTNTMVNTSISSSSSSSSSSGGSTDKSAHWDDALYVPIDQIVYLHCHQPHNQLQQQCSESESEGNSATTTTGGSDATNGTEGGGTVVLVGQDGVQQPPLVFPRGGHLLAFLSCLETGLLPHGQLDPPLWAQRGRAAANGGSMFPPLRRRGRARSDPETEPTDYVFRIVYARRPAGVNSQDLMYPANTGTTTRASGPLSWLSGRPKLSSSTISTSSTSSGKSLSISDTDVCQSNDVFERSSFSSTIEEVAPTTASQTSPCIKQVCASMTRQITSRAFYGWLAHCRHLRTVRTHLTGLVHTAASVSQEHPTSAASGVTTQLWSQWTDPKTGATEIDLDEMMRQVYFGGVEPSLRPIVWPYLLQHHELGVNKIDREERNIRERRHYETLMSEWLAVEAIVEQRDKDAAAAAAHHRSMMGLSNGMAGGSSGISTLNEESESNTDSDFRRMTSSESDSTSNDTRKPVRTDYSAEDGEHLSETNQLTQEKDSIRESRLSSPKKTTYDITSELKNKLGQSGEIDEKKYESNSEESPTKEQHSHSDKMEINQEDDNEDSCCNSPVSSNGGIYSTELLDAFSLNIHRIDKDVQRCDRHHQFFSGSENLITLRNILCSYVWERLDIGYMQGMCDLVAPLLVTLRDECLTYSCFCRLMERMSANFPHGGAMDQHFANMRSLIRVLDTEMFEHMQQNGDYTHFYFCYRWFLLDFKRELVYDDVFRVWETIWAGNQLCSPNFVLFIALALVQTYRDIILDNHMDFTDIIKFFNEMAERHDASQTLARARDLVWQLQGLIQNK